MGHKRYSLLVEVSDLLTRNGSRRSPCHWGQRLHSTEFQGNFNRHVRISATNRFSAGQNRPFATYDSHMCFLAYSVVLNKDPDDYQSYTPLHKIGTSMNKEAGSLIKYYKTGLKEDGYKGYSINYQDLNIDAYKEELWKIVKEILMLQGYDIQKLEEQIFGEELEYDVISNISLKTRDRQQGKRKRSESNVQQNESLAKYLLSLRGYSRS
ncbi:MAG: hypothetical protein WB988_10415 [Candidatus Nitrosopolaris sp.]